MSNSVAIPQANNQILDFTSFANRYRRDRSMGTIDHIIKGHGSIVKVGPSPVAYQLMIGKGVVIAVVDIDGSLPELSLDDPIYFKGKLTNMENHVVLIPQVFRKM